MTYAGLESMIYAGVDKDDPRVKAALSFLLCFAAFKAVQRCLWGIKGHFDR